MTDALSPHACTADPWEDIGGGVRIQRRYVDGALDGVAYTHPGRNGSECWGYVGVIPAWPGEWHVDRDYPLTLSPSLLCRVCGHHGFIREGRWVPC